MESLPRATWAIPRLPTRRAREASRTHPPSRAGDWRSGGQPQARIARGLIRPFDGLDIHVLLELRVPPRPAELRLHRASDVEGERLAVLRRRRIRLDVRIAPVGLPREQPRRAVV